jgi:putative Mn2+ efflux pump MntP
MRHQAFCWSLMWWIIKHVIRQKQYNNIIATIIAIIIGNNMISPILKYEEQQNN